MRRPKASAIASGRSAAAAGTAVVIRSLYPPKFFHAGLNLLRPIQYQSNERVETHVLGEQKLIRRMQSGDRAAFELFVDRFGPSVRALTRRYTLGDADADDLTQEIFIALYGALPGFRGDAKLSTWVYRVAMNHCLKHAARRPAPHLLLEDSLEAAGQDDLTADPARHAEQRELSGRIDNALDALSDSHRDVVILHELQGLTYAECAEALGVPVGTVKSRLFHAFARLRTSLHDYVREDQEITTNTGDTQRPAACVAAAAAAGQGETR